MTEPTASAAGAFEQHRAGRAPQSATLAYGDAMLVNTPFGAFSPAETKLSWVPQRTAALQEYHRLLFASASPISRELIQGITRVEVRTKAAAGIEPNPDLVLALLTIAVPAPKYPLALATPIEAWNAVASRDASGLPSHAPRLRGELR